VNYIDESVGAVITEKQTSARQLIEKFPTLESYLDSFNFQDPLKIIFPNEAEVISEQNLTPLSILSDPAFLERKIVVRVLEAFNLESYYKLVI
jgi:hypothetical protein